jgi:hypothetical protein
MRLRFSGRAISCCVCIGGEIGAEGPDRSGVVDGAVKAALPPVWAVLQKSSNRSNPYNTLKTLVLTVFLHLLPRSGSE